MIKNGDVPNRRERFSVNRPSTESAKGISNRVGSSYQIIRLSECEYERSKRTMWEDILRDLTRSIVTYHRSESLPYQISKKQVNYDGMQLSVESTSSSSGKKAADSDQYQLSKLLGAGAYGHVIQGCVPGLSKHSHDSVAIKIDPEIAFNVWECYIHELVSRLLSYLICTSTHVTFLIFRFIYGVSRSFACVRIISSIFCLHFH